MLDSLMRNSILKLASQSIGILGPDGRKEELEAKRVARMVRLMKYMPSQDSFSVDDVVEGLHRCTKYSVPGHYSVLPAVDICNVIHLYTYCACMTFLAHFLSLSWASKEVIDPVGGTPYSCSSTSAVPAC